MSLVYLRKSFKLDLPEGELSHGGELLPGGKLDIRCWNISKDIWDIWINQRLGDMMMFHLNTPPVSSKLSWMFVAGPTWWHQTFNKYMFNLWHYKTRQKREREKKSLTLWCQGSFALLRCFFSILCKGCLQKFHKTLTLLIGFHSTCLCLTSQNEHPL